MIKVNVFYPHGEGNTFDMDYYCNNHLATLQTKLGDALKGMSVEAGLGSMEPGSPPAYMAIGSLMFDSVEAFQAAFGPHAEATLADIPNYTNAAPVIQISDMKM